MADKPKLVKGTLDNGAVVQCTEEDAAVLGARFTPEKSAAKKASSSDKKS